MTPCKLAILEVASSYSHFDELVLEDDYSLAEIIPACRELAEGGYLTRVQGGYKIADLGRQHIKRNKK